MKPVRRWTLALVLLCGPLAGISTAQDGWAMPDLWPFDNDKESTEGPLLEAPHQAAERPKTERPRFLPTMRFAPPDMSAMVARQFKEFNAASRRFWSGAASMMPFSGASDPQPRLYDDPVTVEDFMAQPRLDP
jgi:hypothetical protein